jgi:hypothetical protein
VPDPFGRLARAKRLAARRRRERMLLAWLRREALMPRTRRFVFVDGREVEAASALGFFEALRRTERSPPADLERYLELLRGRAGTFYGVDFDVGTPGTDLGARCQAALSALMSHGWVRVQPERHATSGPQLLLR